MSGVVLEREADTASKGGSDLRRIDVTPFMRNLSPEHIGRYLVRTSSREAVEQELARLQSLLTKRVRLARMLHRRRDNKAGSLSRRLMSSCRRLKTQLDAISDEIQAKRQRITMVANGQKAAAVSARKRIEDQVAQLMGESGLADCGKSFDNFECADEYPLQREVLKKCRGWARVFPNVKRGFCLYGPSSVGKTHLAKATGAALIESEQPKRVIYVKCSKLAEILKEEYREKDEATLYSRVVASDVVILDDIEKALAGDATAAERNWIKTVLDVIEESGKPVAIATSNAPLEPDGRFTTCHKDNLQEWLYLRLKTLFHWQELNGPNYRERISQDEDSVWWNRY